MNPIQSVRGMPDVLPEQAHFFSQIEADIVRIVRTHNYQEIRAPYVEQQMLFERSIGQETDIIDKEIYAFLDKSDNALALRPEGTAGVQRAACQHSLAFNQPARLWYSGPMFRYERPQKGRTRQFHQFGCEVFGINGPEIELEALLLLQQIWKSLKIEQNLTLHITTLGATEERLNYIQVFRDWLKPQLALLDEDSQKRFESNPLRIWDSKSPETKALLVKAPRLREHLSQESQQRLQYLLEQLREAGIRVKVDDSLVRGLDYYGHTVFEWKSDSLGAQDTVCGGGRYDGLSQQLGFKAMPAFGWALGLERLALTVQAVKGLDAEQALPKPHCYLVSADEEAGQGQALIAAAIRTVNPGIIVESHFHGGGLSAQLKRANKLGAQIAIIRSQESRHRKNLTLKVLESGEQIEISEENLSEISRYISK